MTGCHSCSRHECNRCICDTDNCQRNRACLISSRKMLSVNMSTFLRKVRGSYLFFGNTGNNGNSAVFAGVGHAW